MRAKITVQNVVFHYEVARLYALTGARRTALCFLQRCFGIVVRTANYPQLNFNSVASILASSHLDVNTELEVVEAACKWLKHEPGRLLKGETKRLLLKARLHLLPEGALNRALEEHGCLSALKEVADGASLRKNPSCRAVRLCADKNFDLFACGGARWMIVDDVRDAVRINGRNLRSVSRLAPLRGDRRRAKAVYLNRGELFVFGGCSIFDRQQHVLKYSLVDEKWSTAAEMIDDRQFFCACAFSTHAFVIGGSRRWECASLDSCARFDARTGEWGVIARMQRPRRFAACAVFREAVVVSGGMNVRDGEMSSVERYDVTTDAWSLMPSTIQPQKSHALVSAGSKLFVIGYSNCECFDGENFTAIKSNQLSTFYTCVLVGAKILVVQDNRKRVACYDTERGKWKDKSFRYSDDLCDFSCVRIPSLKC